MLAITLILSCSVVLFAYWFRYSCLLILQTRSRDGFVAPRGLSFPSAQETLRREESENSLDDVSRGLANDYRMLRFLLSQASDVSIDPIERRMLLLDYQLMRVWYFLTRRIARSQARMALEEMTTIMSFLSQSIGTQSTRARAGA